MITNTGLNELKDIMAYLDKVPYCVTPGTQCGGIAGTQPAR